MNKVQGEALISGPKAELEVNTKVEKAVDNLKYAILTGEIKPGDQIKELDYSEQLGVSRGTLRESLASLSNMGFVELFPNQGAFVKTVKPREIRELYDLRQLLETHALWISLEEKGGYDNEHLRGMEEIIQRMTKYENEGDSYQLIQNDVRFHKLICSQAGHGLLLNLFNNLVSLSELSIATLKMYELEEKSDELQHLPILNTIKRGDFFRAKRVLEQHLEKGRKNLLLGLENLPS